MTEFRAARDDFEISDAPERIDVDVVHGFLATSYWAAGIPRATVERALANSLCFGLYKGGAQIGLARLVTDRATFAYLADVFVLPEHRGQGLATWLVGTALTHPAFVDMRRLLLATRDQHKLYARLGFAPLARPERLMEINRPDVYRPAPDAGVRGVGVVFPGLFVLLWSTGFIAAKYGLPYAPPYAFLAWRFVLVAALMIVVALATRAAWPRTLVEYRDLAVVAICVHALYLGGVFVSIDHGMAAGTSAMLVGLQPILTVVIAWRWMREPVSATQWLGLVLGLAGVYFVVRHKVDFGGDASGLLPSAIALVAISVGTLYQKRHCAHIDLRSGAAVQFTVCALLYVPLALFVETRVVQWTPSFLFAIGWSVLVLSVGAISLLYWLLRHGASANVARLFYLVPMVTAIMAYFMFGETLDALALIGMVLIALGVLLARRKG